MYICMYTYTHVHIHMYICMYTYTHVHTYTCNGRFHTKVELEWKFKRASVKS